MSIETRPLQVVSDLTPVIESDAFRDHSQAQFFAGVLAVGSKTQLPSELAGYYDLRARVYIDEQGFLPEEARDASGGEHDADDARAIHFGILENLGVPGEARVVGASRLIVKRSLSKPLPVERLFPEAFPDAPAPVLSVEISRFIARHETKFTQHAISLGLIRSMLGQALDKDYGPGYAVIEKPLAKLFDKINLPFEPLTEPKAIEQYGDTLNFPVKIIPTEVIGSIQPDSHLESSDIMRLFFAQTMEDFGLGHFDETLSAQR